METENKAMTGGEGQKVNGVSRRRQWTPEEKFRIVVRSLTGDEPNIAICRQHNISEPTLYHWRHQFFEGGKNYLANKKTRNVETLKRENSRLKEMLADLWVQYRKLQHGKKID